MSAEKINMVTVYMVTLVAINMLMKFVVIKLVMFLVVRKDIPECVGSLENSADANLQLSVNITMKSTKKYLEIMRNKRN